MAQHHLRGPGSLLRRGVIGTVSLLLLGVCPSEVKSQSQPGALLDQGPIVIQRVRIFDGISPRLLDNASVLIDFVRTAPAKDSLGRTEKGVDVGYFIKEISTNGQFKTPFNARSSRRIDGQGLVLMPGLIDNHVHLSWANGVPIVAFAKRIQQGKARFNDFINEVGLPSSLTEARSLLLHGITSVREVGGIGYLARPIIDPSPDLSDPQRIRLKQGQPGSRIWQAGAVISATGGHADMAADLEPDGKGIDLLSQPLDSMSSEQLEQLSHQLDRFGTRLADGVPDVQKAVRDQFVKKANLIKITTGGGVMSPHDPIDIRTWSTAEVEAAVDVADGYNTYVTSHNYLGEHIIRDIQAGVRMFEHANLLNEKAARLIAERQKSQDQNGRDRSIWLSITPFFGNQYSNPAQGANREKQKITHAGTIKAYAYAKKHNINNLGYGTDVLYSLVGGARKSLGMLANLPKDLAPLKSFRDSDGTVKDFSYSPFELIKMATSNNGLILTMSGPRTPYNGVDNKPLKPGTIGVIRPNAVADLILVRGNPLKSLDFFNNSDNIVLVMKDGTIYKNLLDKRGDDGTRSMGR